SDLIHVGSLARTHARSALTEDRPPLTSGDSLSDFMLASSSPASRRRKSRTPKVRLSRRSIDPSAPLGPDLRASLPVRLVQECDGAEVTTWLHLTNDRDLKSLLRASRLLDVRLGRDPAPENPWVHTPPPLPPQPLPT